MSRERGGLTLKLRNILTVVPAQAGTHYPK
jgi:hypothetical protein